MRFKVFDLALIGADHGFTRRIHNAVKKLIHLAINQANLAFQRCALRLRVLDLGIPQIAKHFESEMEQAFGWFEIKKQGFKFAFDLFLADGFPVVGAFFRITQIVRIKRVAPFRPARRHGLVAMAAGDEAAQGEVLVQVFAGRNFQNAVAAVLHRLPRLKTDERFVLGGDEGKTPFLIGDIARIDGAGEHFDDAFGVHFAPAVFRPCRAGLQKTFHLEQRFEAARGKTFQRFGYDGRQRLIAHQNLAVSGDTLEAVADGGMKHPIAVHHPRPHPVLGLLAVLLPLMLRDRGQQILDEDGIGILPELNGRAFQLAARIADGGAKLQMRFQPTGKAADIIDDDHTAFRAVFLEEVEHGDHRGA